MISQFFKRVKEELILVTFILCFPPDCIAFSVLFVETPLLIHIESRIFFKKNKFNYLILSFFLF